MNKMSQFFLPPYKKKKGSKIIMSFSISVIFHFKNVNYLLVGSQEIQYKEMFLQFFEKCLACNKKCIQNDMAKFLTFPNKRVELQTPGEQSSVRRIMDTQFSKKIRGGGGQIVSKTRDGSMLRTLALTKNPLPIFMFIFIITILI